MRLAERTLTLVQHVARVQDRGALGGLSEHFSDERTPLRAAILPRDGELELRENGLSARQELRLMVPADALLKPGDGLWVGDVLYRILSVQRWFAHLELRCEAV